MSRISQVRRTTGETDIQLDLNLDGSGAGTRTTGVGFFDHLLDALARLAGDDVSTMYPCPASKPDPPSNVTWTPHGAWRRRCSMRA